ncbi:MAG: hypothetical protein HYT16_03395 [DPANN group archaeon]|nr:hypothetical protein [DPANN group archaeon]
MIDMGKRGRLPGSQIRDNLIEILNVLGEAHGYELYKHYRKLFGVCSLRSVYYHLKKGAELGVFEHKGIEKLQGDFSWGSTVERRKFALGSAAKPKQEAKVRAALKA